MLLIVGVLCAGWFMILEFQSIYQFSFLLLIPLFTYNAHAMFTISDAKKLDPYLKQMALSTLAFVVVFGLGLILA